MHEAYTPLLINEKTNTGVRNGAFSDALHGRELNLRPRYKRYLRCTSGWIDFSVGFKTRTDTIALSIEFKNGHARVIGDIPKNTDAVILFADDNSFIDMLTKSSEEVMFMLLQNKIRIRGNHLCALLFSFFMSLLTEELEKNGLIANGGKPVKKPKPAHAVRERPSMRRSMRPGVSLSYTARQFD